MRNANAIEYYRRGFTEYAIHLFKWPAKHCGFTPSYYNLGICYEKKKDLQKALQCYEKAAKENHKEANYNIGCLILRNPEYFSERYDKRDGISFIKTASELGLAKAQSHYGSLLLEDQTDEDKIKEGVRLLKEAANQRCNDAIYNLGICHEMGFGVSKDPVHAAECYYEASLAGQPEAQHNLGVFYEYGWGDLEKSNEKALKWFTLAVENGHKQTSIDVERLQRNGVSEGILTNDTASTTDKLQTNQNPSSESFRIDTDYEVTSLDSSL